MVENETDMDWKSYEEVTRDIYQVMGKGHGVRIECHGNACKKIGKSGVWHQIDVLTSHSDGMHDYFTAIECKYWNDTVNKDIVMKVAEIVEDCNFTKGVIVSKIGFTEDAINYAKFRNVGLVELRKPLDKDWEGRLREMSVEIHLLSPRLIGFHIHTDKPAEKEMKSVYVPNYFLEYPNGDKKPISKIIEDFFNTKFDKTEVVVKDSLMLPEGTIMKSTESEDILQVKSICLEGVMDLTIEKLTIRGDDYVKMIMKKVLEDKEYMVTKEGEIKETNRNDD